MTGDGLDKYEKGGFYRVDDRSGARVRARDTREEWNGAIVAAEDFEPRHPQDFVRSRPDRQNVPKPRPVPPIIDVGPKTTTTTADAASQATSLVVTSSTGFHNGGRVKVMLDNGDAYLGTISAIPDSTHLTITPGLPGPVTAGATVIDNVAPTVSL